MKKNNSKNLSNNVVDNIYNDSYKDVINIIKGKYAETQNAYIIDEYYFSKNKVNREINYLINLYSDMDKDTIIIASLLHDSRLDNDDMENVIDKLGLKVK